MADAIALGVESTGSAAHIRAVPSLNQSSSSSAVYSEQQNDFGHLYVTKQDLDECHGIVLGTPSRFGTMAAPMKAFWETTSTEWLKGQLIDKPASVFTSSSSMHGGNEVTLLTLSLPLIHHGMVLLGLPYSEPALSSTNSGGTPYGASHVSGLSNSTSLSPEEHSLCKAQGERIATIAQKLSVV